MNKFLLFISIILSTGVCSAGMIENPDFEVRNTGVIKPIRVERTKDNTRITFHAVFRPNYWIRIDSTARLIDSFGKSYNPVALEGMSLNQHFWMPESGEHDFTVIYPPLPDNVDVVDFDEISWKIKGLRLDGKPASKNSEIDLQEWEREHYKEYPGEPAEFFIKGDAFLRGRIGGYSRKLGFDNFLIVCEDDITGTTIPVVVPVSEDGSFSAEIPLSSPKILNCIISDQYDIPVYLEPGRTLELAFNWEDLLDVEIKRLLDFRTPKVKTAFGGELGSVNNEIFKFPYSSLNIVEISQYLVPQEALLEIRSNYEHNKKALTQYIIDNKPCSTSEKVIRANIDCDLLESVFGYDYLRRHFNHADTVSLSNGKPLDLSFFEEAKKIESENNEWLLSGLNLPKTVNRMAFSDLLKMLEINETMELTVNVNQWAYLKSLGAVLSAEEEEWCRFIDKMIGERQLLSMEEIRYFFNRYNSFSAGKIAERSGLEEQWAKFVDDNISDDGSTRIVTLSSNEVYDAEKFADSLNRYLETDSLPLLWQVVESAKLCSYGGLRPDDLSYEDVLGKISKLQSGGVLTHPAVINSLKEFYDDYYNISSYPIPNDDNGKVIRELLRPHSGRILLLCFWNVNCEPCRAFIESTKEKRALNLDNPDFKMIFISRDTDSDRKDYDRYVAENLEGEVCYRIPVSDYNRLRTIFNFMWVPDFVLIGRDGNVLDSHINFSNYEGKLKQLGITLKNPEKN